jgi:hypothetical protein
VNYFFTDTQKVSVPSSFFIGWRQLDQERLNLGLDRNIDHSDKVKYSVDGGFNWYTSPFEGSAMLRPIFSTALDASLGIKEPAIETPVWSCYPNPSSDIVHIELPSQYHGKTFQLLNMQGQVLLQTQDLTFNTQDLPSGVYILNCESSNLTPLKLIIK